MKSRPTSSIISLEKASKAMNSLVGYYAIKESSKHLKLEIVKQKSKQVMPDSATIKGQEIQLITEVEPPKAGSYGSLLILCGQRLLILRSW